MKVRIGIGFGGADMSPDELCTVVDDMVDVGLDSLWLPEILSRPSYDPLLALAWVGAHNRKLKLGTTMLLPGRNLFRLAKQLASLDVLTNGRFLVTFVPGIAIGAEREAVGVPVRERGAAMDAAFPVVRRLLEGGEVEGFTLSPLPKQAVFSMWLGGMQRASLDRCGRLADGWLPSLCTPEDAAAGKRVIDDAAAAAGRVVDPEHFGVSISYATSADDLSSTAAEALRARNPASVEVLPVGLPALRDLLSRYLDVGFSKFVLRPLVPPASWRAELEGLAVGVGDLQT